MGALLSRVMPPICFHLWLSTQVLEDHSSSSDRLRRVCVEICVPELKHLKFMVKCSKFVVGITNEECESVRYLLVQENVCGVSLSKRKSRIPSPITKSWDIGLKKRKRALYIPESSSVSNCHRLCSCRALQCLVIRWRTCNDCRYVPTNPHQVVGAVSL